jgi:hypothetical protein
MSAAPNIKRLVDLVDRGPEDDLFYPASSNNTIFHREHEPYHNVVPEIVEIGYQGNAAWGQRITVNLTRKDSGDLLQWLCVRITPRSWLGGDLDAKINSGLWDYKNPESAWMWAGSLGTAAIKLVEFEIGDSIVESWPGEWMDIWSRAWLEGGRAAVWEPRAEHASGARERSTRECAYLRVKESEKREQNEPLEVHTHDLL